LTPDPYMASVGAGDPGSWNRYAYTRGDPINRKDPRGTCDQSADDDKSVTVCGDDDDDDNTGGPGGGGGSSNPTQQTPGPGGGGSGGSTNGARIPGAQTLADAALGQDKCAAIFGTPPPLGSGWFGSGPTPTPTQILDSIIAGGTYGSISFTNAGSTGFVAQTDPSLTSVRLILGTGQIVYTNFTVLINTALNPGTNMWNSGSATDNATTLLHELGHILDFMGWTGGQFVNDDSDASVNLANTKLIQDNCTFP